MLKRGEKEEEPYQIASYGLKSVTLGHWHDIVSRVGNFRFLVREFVVFIRRQSRIASLIILRFS